MLGLDMYAGKGFVCSPANSCIESNEKIANNVTSQCM